MPPPLPGGPTLLGGRAPSGARLAPTIVAGRGLLAALVKGDEPVTYGRQQPVVGRRHALRRRAALAPGLYRETGRKAIPSGGIVFVGGTFTNQIEISVEFTTDDVLGGGADWQLREFAVFAGGTLAAGSGVMLNHRIHPRIDLQPGFTLQRTLRLTF